MSFDRMCVSGLLPDRADLHRNIANRSLATVRYKTASNSSEQIKIGADPAIACITLFDTAIEERTARILLAGSAFPLLNRKFRSRVTFHATRLSSNAVILWRWVSRCQRSGADVLRLWDGFFGGPSRRGIDRHFTTDRIPLVIRASLITVGRATANQIGTDGNVRLLVRPHLAISLFELLNQLLLFCC